MQRNKDGILVDGSSGLLIRFAGCCSPVQGDGIVGYISRGKGVTIHRDNCPNLKYLEKERLIQATWDENSEKPFVATIKILAEDCPNLISLVIKELENFKVKSMDSHTKGTTSNATIKIEVKKKEELTALIKKLKQIKGVVDVFRWAMIINTNTEEFKNDIYDIMHLFYSDLILNEEDGVVLNHKLTLTDSSEEKFFDINGKTTIYTQ